MSIYYQNNGTIQQIGGGINQPALERIAALENTVSILTEALHNITESKATETNYGLAKISESTTVTETGSGLVLSAKEKNPSIDGTLARKMEQIQNSFGVLDISNECNSDYSIEGGMNQKIILKIPAIKMIFGSFIITGRIANQTVVLTLPVESACSGSCGLASCHEKDMNASLRVSGRSLISNHSVDTSITNGKYLFFIKYK